MKEDKEKNGYGKALREVYEVIDNMELEDTNKISPAFLSRLHDSADWSYDFQYDRTKSLQEQNLLDDTRIILAIIYMRYFATNKEKAELLKIIKEN